MALTQEQIDAMAGDDPTLVEAITSLSDQIDAKDQRIAALEAATTFDAALLQTMSEVTAFLGSASGDVRAARIQTLADAMTNHTDPEISA